MVQRNSSERRFVMAKKDKNKENKVSTDESTGSKIVTVLIVLVIVVIWLAILVC